MYYIQQINNISAEFNRQFGHLTTEQLNWKPAPNIWSIAQNISHLIVINKTYFPTFQALINGNYQSPFIAKFGFLVNFFGKSILNSVQPDRLKKMRTFPMWEPEKSAIDEGILSKFTQHQEELISYIPKLVQFIDNGDVISSPANKIIVYKLGTALEIIITHEKRHFAQATEVLDISDFK